MKAATIVDALATWSQWHADVPPLGTTGDYLVDMQLADAFRALLYRETVSDQLEWIYRESQRPRRDGDCYYLGEIIRWWLAIWEANYQRQRAG